MKLRFTFLLFMVALAALPAFCTNHIITFANYYYSPANTSVAVGDTITWQGDFSFHPLSTTATPSGAMSIVHVDIGTSYSYVVTVPGSYSYRCDSHYTQGMFGTFTATLTSVEEVAVAKPSLSFKLSTLGGVIKISNQSGAKGDTYDVRIGSILGESVYSGTMSSEEHEQIIDIQDKPQGVYLLAISDGNHETFVRKFLIQ